MISDNHLLLSELQDELQRLESPEYRKAQDVRAGVKQLRLLRRLLARAKNLREADVADFCRCVSDSAPTGARISVLAEELYALTLKERSA